MQKLYNKQYGLIQQRQIPNDYKKKAVEWLQPAFKDTILEIGAGSGDMVQFLKISGASVTGIDLNESLLENKNISDVIAADATTLPFAENTFTKSISLHALEHIKDLQQVFIELDRVSIKGALSFHAFPNEKWRGEGAYFEASQMTNNRISAWRLARKLHVHSLNPQKIQNFIKDTNWKLIKQENLYVPPEEGYAWLVLLQKSRF